MPGLEVNLSIPARLRFVNITDDERFELFGVDLAKEVTKGLRAVSRGAIPEFVSHFSGPGRDPCEIGKEAGAEVLLDGQEGRTCASRQS